MITIIIYIAVGLGCYLLGGLTTIVVHNVRRNLRHRRRLAQLRATKDERFAQIAAEIADIR